MGKKLTGSRFKPSEVSSLLADHYRDTFDRHGPTSEGVDWGGDQKRVELRYRKMLAVKQSESGVDDWKETTLLDVGCGFGGLLSYARLHGMEPVYSGIDVAANMIDWARQHFEDSARFIHGDILDTEFENPFDFLVCSGILTQKLTATDQQMDEFANALIRRMFGLCKIGIGFNIMTDRVNFRADNLYYRNPSEVLQWCLDEVTDHVRIDHSYPLYEYTVYLYRGGR